MKITKEHAHRGECVGSCQMTTETNTHQSAAAARSDVGGGQDSVNNTDQTVIDSNVGAGIGSGIGAKNGHSDDKNGQPGASKALAVTNVAVNGGAGKESNNPFKRRPADVIWPSQYIRPDYRRGNDDQNQNQNVERTVDRRNRGVYLRMPHVEGLEPEIGGIGRPVRLAAGISNPRDPRRLMLTNNKAKRSKFDDTHKQPGH